MASIPDFSDPEFELVAQTLFLRYGNAVPLERVEVELLLDPAATTLDVFPALFWTAHKTDFVICKTGDARFRTQFFRANGDPFGAGRDEFDDLGECITAVLRAAADDAARRSGIASGTSNGGNDGYDGPIVI